jgi:small conductance mechanosensitive channel
MGTAGGSPRAATRRLQRLHAISGAARSGLSLILGAAALLLSLAQFVNLAPVLAGAGLAGLVIGFGAQSLIADLLAGFSMLVEDQYGVGDWIDVDGKVGEVEHVGLRTTSFRDLDGTVWHVPNGQVQKVGNLSQRWARATLEIPLPLDIDIIHARKIVSEVAHGLANDPRWADDIIAAPQIWGVTEWNAEGLRLRLVVATRPLRNWDINRQLRERLHIAFAQENIRMPVAMREMSGSPLRSPVRLHGVDTDAIAERDLPAYDPTQTDRLGGEWDWPYPDVEPGDDSQRRPVRPE